ncbi:DNA helicase [Ranunculus cassubicifolius]
MFPGDVITRLAADKLPEVDERDPTNPKHIPSEYLNTLDPSGLPPFELKMKVGSPIMLLRNLAPKDGMCNGTRLRVVEVKDHCINAVILNGDKAGEPVFIPRISLTPSGTDIPVKFSRCQFPVRLAFAMTINKSQGQSVKYVGVDLRNEVFSHGQLYVALSRCTSASRISVLLPPDSNNETKNIVYPEVLL